MEKPRFSLRSQVDIVDIHGVPSMLRDVDVWDMERRDVNIEDKPCLTNIVIQGVKAYIPMFYLDHQRNDKWFHPKYTIRITRVKNRIKRVALYRYKKRYKGVKLYFNRMTKLDKKLFASRQYERFKAGKEIKPLQCSKVSTTQPLKSKLLYNLSTALEVPHNNWTFSEIENTRCYTNISTSAEIYVSCKDDHSVRMKAFSEKWTSKDVREEN